MRARGIKVKMTCWDMGFVRRGRILIEQGLITRPGYFLFHLTEGKYITGHACTEAGVDALRCGSRNFCTMQRSAWRLWKCS